MTSYYEIYILRLLGRRYESIVTVSMRGCKNLCPVTVLAILGLLVFPVTGSIPFPMFLSPCDSGVPSDVIYNTLDHLSLINLNESSLGRKDGDYHPY